METKQFIRDTHSQAIINNDKQGFLRFKQQRERELQLQKALNEVDNIKKEIRDIKKLLQQLIDGQVNG